MDISLPFDDALENVFGWALAGTQSTDVDIDTTDLLFGLSQVQPTRGFLNNASTNGSLEQSFDALRSDVHSQPARLDTEELGRYKLSSSVDKIQERAIDRARITGASHVNPTHVLEAVVETHPDYLEERGIDLEQLRVILRRAASFAARALADTATATDHLNREAYARALAGLIKGEATATPLTIGIYGPWGQGKTSLMLQMRGALSTLHEGKKGVLPHVSAWFDAWQFDQRDKVWAALITEIYKTYRASLSWWKRAGYYLWKNKWQALVFAVAILAIGIAIAIFAKLLQGEPVAWTVAVGSALGLAGFPAAWKFGSSVFGPLLRRLVLARQLGRYLQRSSYREKLGFQQQVQQDLRGMLEALLEPPVPNRGAAESRTREKKRLVVFIDDLDRCSPDSVVEVLEAIRVFFNHPGVIVVLGLDERFVGLAVAERYAHIVAQDETPETRIQFGRSYLEKMVQLPVYLQSPKSYDLLPYALDMAKSLDSPGTSEEEPAVERRTPRQDNAQGKRPKARREKAKEEAALAALEFDEEVQEALEELKAFLPNNPRQLKRVLNLYRLVHYLIAYKGHHFDGKVALAWLLFRKTPNGLAEALEKAIIEAPESSEAMTIQQLLKIPASDAAAAFSVNSTNAELLSKLYPMTVKALKLVASHAVWFCVPYEFSEESAKNS